MQFKVPQDVQQADRIVWFLTLPQLIICVVGFGIAYGVYSALQRQGLPWVIWLPPVAIIGLLTGAFAFLRIANLAFHQYIALIIERFITPSKKLWVKGADRIVSEEVFVSPEEKKKEELAKKITEAQAEKEKRLEAAYEMSEVLDTLKKEPKKEEPLAEIDKTKDVDLIREAFGGEAPHGKEVEEKTVSKEEKILTVGKEPIVITDIPKATPQEEIQPKKKRRRRRRKNKMMVEPATPASLIEKQAALVPTVSVPTVPVPTVPATEQPSTAPIETKASPPPPSWLEEPAKTSGTLKEDTPITFP